MRKLLTLALGLFFVALPACEEAPTMPDGTTAELQADSRLAARGGPANVVEVVATGLDFQVPDEIPSGWTTFRFLNQSGMTHFAIIEKMPTFEGEQMTVEDSKAEVVPVFQNFMDSFNGTELSYPEAGFELPAWYGEVVFMGGPGLTGPGQTSEVTQYMEPGTYVIECYFKTADGVFHSTLEMIVGLTVTDDVSRAKEPKANLELTISSENGIEVNGDPRPGNQSVSVRFEDQAVYGHFLGHDVHLARVDAGTDINEVADWMSWTVPGGLASPAPAEFIGGIQDMPAGETGYINVLLKPGTYAWIAEVPDPEGKNMLETFTVPGGPSNGR